jgi:dTDP-4-dehydrorhamnose 3,5-epimerase
MRLKKIKLKRFIDNRGYLLELIPKEYQNIFKYSIITSSKKNVIRGLHYDKLFNEKKLIYILKGNILDVTVDILKRKVFYNNLKKNDALFIPKGFAHGYKCLSKENIMIYFLSKNFNIKNQRGIIWNDTKLNIKWACSKPIISFKDRKLPSIK